MVDLHMHIYLLHRYHMQTIALVNYYYIKYSKKLIAPYDPSFKSYAQTYNQPQPASYEPFDVDKYLASIGITTSLPSSKTDGIFILINL